MLQEVGRGYRRLKVFTMGYKEFARDWYHDILYQNTPTSRICLPGVGQFAEVPCRRVAVYNKQVPRYHWDTKNIPSNARGQVKRSNKA